MALKAGQLPRSRACSRSPVALLVFGLSSALPARAWCLVPALAFCQLLGCLSAAVSSQLPASSQFELSHRCCYFAASALVAVILSLLRLPITSAQLLKAIQKRSLEGSLVLGPMRHRTFGCLSADSPNDSSISLIHVVLPEEGCLNQSQPSSLASKGLCS